MSEHEQKNDPWANLADALGAKPVAKPVTKPATPPEAVTPPTPARSTQKPRDEKPAPAVRSDWGGLASALGLEPASESKPAAQSGRPQPVKPLPPADPPAREVVEPPQRRSDRERDEFSFGSRRPAAESVPQQSREPIDSIPRRDPPRSQRTEESASPEPLRSENFRPGGDRSESGSRDRTDRDRTDRDRTDSTARRGPVKTSRVRAVVGVAVVGAEAADVVAVTKDANVRCRAKRMVNTARTRVQPQGECLPAEKRTTVLNGH